jgi:hypothetical protein
VRPSEFDAAELEKTTKRMPRLEFESWLSETLRCIVFYRVQGRRVVVSTVWREA